MTGRTRVAPFSRRLSAILLLFVGWLAVLACDSSSPQGLPGPTAKFSATPRTGYAPLVVNFKDESIFAGSWQWDLTGDGTVNSTSQNPQFTYNDPGTYTISLKVGGNLQEDSITREAYIEVKEVPVRIDVDANRTGVVDLNSGGVSKTTWSATSGAIFMINCDNDSNQPNPFLDLQDTIVNGPEDAKDLGRVILRQLPSILEGGSALVRLDTVGGERVNIFRNVGNGNWISAYQHGSGGQFTIPIDDLIAGDVELGVEARFIYDSVWNGRVTLTFSVRDKDNKVVAEDSASLWVAPWIMASNTWPVEQLIIGDFRNSGGSSNTAFYNLCESVCNLTGIQFVTFDGNAYGGDRWIQDSHEPGVFLLPGENNTIRRIDVTLQLPRNRPADMFCLMEQLGPNFGVLPRFIGSANSLSYGGNLELVPPLPGHPLGRVIVGGAHDPGLGTTVTGQTGGHNPAQHPDVYKQFYNDGLQGPTNWISSEWLIVGHIDEFSMFVSAPTTTRGWALLYADADMAINQIAQLPASDDARTIFTGRSMQTTVGALKADVALHQFNQDVQVRLDLIRARLKNLYGLTDADFIEIAGAYESLNSFGDAAAYNPGMVNLIPLPLHNGDVHFIVPDPEGPQGNDVWRNTAQSTLEGLGASGQIHVHFADVFNSYHLLLGEAHCGSNTVRTPPDHRWWED